MSEKHVDTVSSYFFWLVPLTLFLFLHPHLSLCCESEARPDELLCQRECSSEGGEALFLCERCIFLLSTGMAASASPWLPPSQSPSFSLHFSCSFLSSSRSLSLSLSASYLELYRGQIEGIIFLRLWIFCHAVILKVPFCSCVQDKSKTFFYSCNQCPSPFSTALPFSSLLGI